MCNFFLKWISYSANARVQLSRIWINQLISTILVAVIKQNWTDGFINYHLKKISLSWDQSLFFHLDNVYVFCSTTWNKKKKKGFWLVYWMSHIYEHEGDMYEALYPNPK